MRQCERETARSGRGRERDKLEHLVTAVITVTRFDAAPLRSAGGQHSSCHTPALAHLSQRDAGVAAATAVEHDPVAVAAHFEAVSHVCPSEDREDFQAMLHAVKEHVRELVGAKSTEPEIHVPRAEFVAPTRGTCDPLEVYPEVAEVSHRLFALKPEGLSKEEYTSALERLQQYYHEQRQRYIGYQNTQGENYEHLAPFLRVHLNNVGDPFASGNLMLNSKVLERAVLDRYASLWRAKWPHDPHDVESYWGYVLSMGSTEGNLYALYNARDYLEGKALLHDPESDEDRFVCCAPR